MDETIREPVSPAGVAHSQQYDTTDVSRTQHYHHTGGGLWIKPQGESHVSRVTHGDVDQPKVSIYSDNPVVSAPRILNDELVPRPHYVLSSTDMYNVDYAHRLQQAQLGYAQQVGHHNKPQTGEVQQHEDQQARLEKHLQQQGQSELMQHIDSEAQAILDKQPQRDTPATTDLETCLVQQIENQAHDELMKQQVWSKHDLNSQDYPVNLTQHPVDQNMEASGELPRQQDGMMNHSSSLPNDNPGAPTQLEHGHIHSVDASTKSSELFTGSTLPSECDASAGGSNENDSISGQSPAPPDHDPMDILLEQKQQLHEYRNYGVIDQEKILTNVAQEAIDKLTNSTDTPDTLVPEENITDPSKIPEDTSGKHDKNHIQSLLNESLVEFCHNNLYFVEFVHISGRFSFNVDNRETMNLAVSQMATPQAFSDTPKPAKSSTPKRKPTAKKAPSKTPKTPPTSTPRKRGRPRKVVTDDYQTPVPSKKKSIKLETPPSPPVVPSSSQGQGRRAAAKARQKLIKIVDDSLEFNDDSESDIDVPEEDLMEDEDYMPDPDQLTDRVVTPKKRRSRAESTTDAELGEVPQLIKDINLIKKEIDDGNTEEDTGVLDQSDNLEDSNDESPGKDESSKMNESTGNDERKFGCDHCGKRFVEEELLEKHVADHKVFTCYEKGCQDVKCYTRADIRKHFRDVHDKQAKQLHRCSKCRQEFLTAEKLKTHMQESYSHICSVCGENFNDKATLRKHKDSTHLEKTCHICGKNFVSKGAFNRHMKRHREKAAGKIKCTECEKEFTAHSSLFHHKKAVHMGIKPYQCNECGMTFNFNNSLKLHLLKHSGVRPYKCDVCDKSYLTASHLKNHVQALHSHTKQYACPVCDKHFPYDNSLKLHMRLHTGDRPYMCSLCSKTFVSRSALKVHESAHVESRDFKCEICNKSYKTEALMRVHRRRHTADGSRYMCDICGNTYMYKSNLEVHYEVHGDAKKHECKVCGKTFKTYPTLYSHYLVHSDKNPFTCASCGKSFKTRERLKAHSIRHSGLKPYICECCGSSFPDKGGLSKHRKTVHAEVARFACPVCGKPCNRADNLRVHMKVHGDPALLKLSLEELAAASKNPETYNKPSSYRNTSNTSGSDVSPVKMQIIKPDVDQSSQHSLHMMETAQEVDSMRVPITRPEAYNQPEEVATVTQPSTSDHMTRITNPQEVMSQMSAAAAPFMGMHHWGTDGALHYQNLLLAQGYPTGMVQAQIPHTENPTTVSYQPTTHHDSNSQY